MTQLANDEFNRADSTDLGAVWESGYTGDTNLQIVGNRVRGTSTSLDSTETHTVTLPNDQYAKLTISTIAGTGAVAPRLILRFSPPPTKSGYEFTALRNLGATTTRITRWDAGAYTNLVEDTTATWAAGDTLVGTAIGSTLTVSRNGSVLLTTTDATYPSGRAGIIIYSTSTVAGEVDDLVAGSTLAASGRITELAALGWNLPAGGKHG